MPPEEINSLQHGILLNQLKSHRGAITKGTAIKLGRHANFVQPCELRTLLIRVRDIQLSSRFSQRVKDVLMVEMKVL
jgi:hypothetical protein